VVPVSFLRRPKSVFILGCGPAGLFAAQAAESLGHHVTIISKLRRSEMYGAQYLHSEIPGLTDGSVPFKVEYRLNGSLDDYLWKVYGATIPDRAAITVESLVGTYDAWDIRRAYHNAFQKYMGVIHNHNIGGDTMYDILVNSQPDLLVSTIPATTLCTVPDQHAFDVRKIWAVGDAPERGTFAPRFGTEDGVIQYDGTRDTGWYRSSSISGYVAVEWPGGRRPPIENVVEVNKPVSTTCDCWLKARRTKVIRLGRYGAWDRKGHTHQAYWATLKTLQEM
jgi:hypothetical protein